MRALTTSVVLTFAAFGALAAEPMLDIKSKEFQDAMDKAMQSCSPAPVSGFSASQLGTSKFFSEVVCTVSPWPGQCIDGKSDGPGQVQKLCNSRLRMDDQLPTTSTNLTISTGTMVRGKFAGLVETFNEFSPLTAGQPPIRFKFYRFAEGTPPDMFAKMPDGNYQPVLGPSGTPAPKPAVAAAEMERLSTGLIADARALASGGKVAPRNVAIKALEDLLPGGKIEMAPNRQIPDAKSRSLAVVLSSNTIKDSERYKAMLRSMKAEARSIPEVRDAFGVKVTASERIRYLERVEPPAVLEGIFLSLAKSFRTVAPVDDLGAAKAMNADYSVVLDVAFPSATTPFLCELHFVDSQLRLVGSVQCAGNQHFAKLFGRWKDPGLSRYSLGEGLEAPPDVMLARHLTTSVDSSLKQVVP